MRILANLVRVLLAAFAIVAVSPAVAASAGSPTGAYSPSGMWEIKVGGIFEGETVKGQAYIAFDSDGNLNGYYLSRMGIEVYEIVGTWNQEDKKFSGYVEVYDSIGIYAAFAMTGAARSGVSMTARLTDPAQNRITLVGKPLVETVDFSGSYYGSIRQYGMVGAVGVQLTPDGYGSYQVSGLLNFAGQIDELIGYAMVNRSGKFVAYVLNMDSGVYSCFWGTASPTRVFTGSGRSLNDGSSIRLRMNSSL